MTDKEIIELFFNRDERGIAEVQKAYGSRLVHFAERYLSKEDAEECVNDTYLLLWKHIPPAEPDHFYAYAVKALRNLVLNRLESMNARMRKADLIELSDELADCLPDRSPLTETLAIEHVSGVINRFLNTQGQEKRHIFLRRYWFGDPVSVIALSTGSTESKIKKMLQRLKKELRRFLEEDRKDQNI
ncbi:MAG: sigma-70 family RNA polymerase sigma factor [Lachnospiraceae bacterium]|nr:sigma-70 family RNA polymerase sigma factor [Lachnospiraceae bacterium]